MPASRATSLAGLLLLGGTLAACGGTPTAAVGAAPTTAVSAHVNGSPAAAAPDTRLHADGVQVDKCWTNATRRSGGQMLLKARSSDHSARLYAYGPDGVLLGELQNGGGNRYGGTVISWVPSDPGHVVVRSSAGGQVTVPTAPFPAT